MSDNPFEADFTSLAEGSSASSQTSGTTRSSVQEHVLPEPFHPPAAIASITSSTAAEDDFDNIARRHQEPLFVTPVKGACVVLLHCPLVTIDEECGSFIHNIIIIIIIIVLLFHS